MLHQLIFAHPKPGMSEKEFQDYWVNHHAVKYASKIPQIRRYMVDTRIPCGPEPENPLFSGCAEIWLEDIGELLSALQSKEFVEGARIDEPNWAAFWQTIALNTTAHILLEGPPFSRESTLIKLFFLVKRKPGMSLEDFRRYSLDVHGPKTLSLPGLRRYYQCHVPDEFYAVGESPLDLASILWFDDVKAVEAMMESSEFKNVVEPDMSNYVDPKYIHHFAAEEHWIIGPDYL